MLIENFSINAPLDEPTILKLPVAYRTAIDRNRLGLLEDRLVYYEPILLLLKIFIVLLFQHYFVTQFSI